jgi:hypothetical protein
MIRKINTATRINARLCQSTCHPAHCEHYIICWQCFCREKFVTSSDFSHTGSSPKLQSAFFSKKPLGKHSPDGKKEHASRSTRDQAKVLPEFRHSSLAESGISPASLPYAVSHSMSSVSIPMLGGNTPSAPNKNTARTLPLSSQSMPKIPL